MDYSELGNITDDDQFGARSVEYRGYTITYDPPPIPDRRHDYSFVHHDYTGPGDYRHGTAASIEDAEREIDMIYDEEEEGGRPTIEGLARWIEPI